MTKPLKIVIADDESDMRDYLSLLLPRLGHEVTGIASTGTKLVEVCRETRPDLIITDVRMPDLDGVEAVKQIHCEQPIPVIFISAFADVRLPKQTGDHIIAHLHKPVGRADLESAIGKVLVGSNGRPSAARES